MLAQALDLAGQEQSGRLLPWRQAERHGAVKSKDRGVEAAGSGALGSLTRALFTGSGTKSARRVGRCLLASIVCAVLTEICISGLVVVRHYI